ncbi:hypothetical protein BH24ACI5_BH24ACI5_13590 [soil metagenome]
MRVRLARLMMLCAALVAFAAPSAAQVFTGRIDVTVTDTTGAILPGVLLELTGPQNTSAVTDAQGEARFLNLTPGTYTVSAKMEGFTPYLNRNVPVVAGGGVPLRIVLGVGGVAQTIDVTAETPVIDSKRTTTSTNVTLEELQGIPSSRDPWVVFQTVPGIIVDRVNVGGAESGQQSSYQAKGASGGENTWNIDGIPITDMAATGASPTYYDFDMFSEMQVTTGGADVQNATPGVHLNMVLKSGTNTPHGSSRVFFSNEDMQSNNLSADLAEKIGGVSKKGNRTDQYADYGGEIGGPILKDRLWAWGSYGKTDVRIRTLTDVLDRTILENMGFKTTAQIGTNFRPSFTYFYGDKIKNGRGASATRPDETTWNQAGPTAIYKGETSFVLSNNLFLTARGAYSDMGFTLTPRGGLDKDTYRDDGGVWHNSYYLYGSNRPQKTVLADGNYFRGRHELKFGFSWRNAVVESYFQWPGSKVATIHIGYPTMLPIVTRDWVANTEGNYLSGYIGDTMTWDRLTLNVGARIDTATSSVTEAVAGGSPVLPSVLPGITGPAVKNAFDYTNVTPRLGATFALDERRKTLLRGSYSMFSSQLSAAEAEFVSSIQFSGIYYLAVDQNGNNTTEVNEILFSQGNQGYYGFDPADPASTTSVNRIGDPKSPRTYEALFGVDRELFRNFGVSATFTYRRFNNTRWNPLIGVTRADYRETGVLEGNVDPLGQFSQPYYALDKAKVPPGGGRIAENRPGYHQRFLGFEMSATKRMSNRWMARLGFSTNDHREYFTDPDRSIQDPTPGPGSALQDGGVVVRESGGSGKAGIYMILPKYQFIANGLVQGPWGFNIGANLVTRQGFGTPWFRSNVVTGDPLSNRKSVLAVKDLDERRLPAVTSLDVRLEKAFRVSRANIIFDLDVFNVTNTDTVLGRQYDMRLTGARGFNNVLEIMNPRILRLGLRLNF